MKKRTFAVTSLLLTCCFCTLSKSVPASQQDVQKNLGHSWEQYDPNYFTRFQSIDDIIIDADKHFAPAGQATLAYYVYISDILEKRFYHGYSVYSFTDNPLAYLSGRFVWNHLSAIVLPEDIMKHQNAACSQQAIVLIEIFRRKGIDYRAINLPNHFTVEAYIQGGWHYFDTNLEPILINNPSLHDLVKSGKWLSGYDKTGISKATLNNMSLNFKYETLNALPAPRARFFHIVCNYTVSFYTLLSLVMCMMWNAVVKNRNKAFYGLGIS